MNQINPTTDEEYQQQLDQEYRDRGSDYLDSMDELLDQAFQESADYRRLIEAIHDKARDLKGLGASYGYSVVTVLAHRMDDYLSELTALSRDQVRELQLFADRLRVAISQLENPDAEVIAAMVRSLPAKPGFRVEDIEILNIEIMLVLPPGAATRFVTAELQECGYRVTNVASPVDAIRLAVQSRPDLVIASAVLPDLSGIDLACAFSAMPATRKVAVALLTSLGRDDDSLLALPATVPIVRKGSSFGDDVAAALAVLGIT